MEVSDFDYELPEELIAQRPAENREESRLMVVNRREGTFSHRVFRELAETTSESDLFVLNDTRVFPARLMGSKPATGGQVEIFLLRKLDETAWEALVRPARRVPPGTRVVIEAGRLEATIAESLGQKKRRVLLEASNGEVEAAIEAVGQVPLPPYIRRSRHPDPIDRERYQTVFARRSGSIAAPTAGLHFSSKQLSRIRHCTLTLHVGYGTFRPVEADRVEDHRLDEEFYEISEGAADQIRRARLDDSRLISVGTTTTRALEHVAREEGAITAGQGWARLYIYPGFEFRVCDGLLTNFHLPRSSLLFLVAAFAGRELILEAYREAVRQRYRFYSYGDAMLIL